MAGSELIPFSDAGIESRRTVTVVFSDLVDSTALGEQLDSEALREIMSTYFAEVRRAVERHGGTLEKYIGDAVMAVFGLPRSHEDDALKNGYGSEIAGIKREYYRICLGLMDEFKRAKGIEFNSRLAVLSLFGMMNWIYTWHNSRVDADAGEIAQEMGDIFLHGVSKRKN